MLAILFAALALTSETVCDAGHETPECAAEQIAEATRNLSLPSIQTQFDEGAQVYRAVFDGGNHGRPAVSFERRPARSPELVIYGTGGVTVRREVSAEVWESVRDSSRYVGRKLERIEGYSRNCLVSSDAVVQISRPRSRRPDQTSDRLDFFGALDGAGVTEVDQNSCEGGLTWDYAELLAEIACEQLPECDAMGLRSQWMMSVQNLETIFLLRGDRVAAATLHRDAGWAPLPVGNYGALDAAETSEWLNPARGAVLDWNGVKVTALRASGNTAPDAISEFLHQRSADGRMTLDVVEVGAESTEVGWISGIISQTRQIDGSWITEQAAYRQVWLRDGDGWELWSMTVGPFGPTELAAE